jgi:hypothetical protein
MIIKILENQLRHIIENQEEFSEITLINQFDRIKDDRNVDFLKLKNTNNNLTIINYLNNPNFNFKNRITNKNEISNMIIEKNVLNLFGLNDVFYMMDPSSGIINLSLFNNDNKILANLEFERFNDGITITYINSHVDMIGKGIGVPLYEKLSDVLNMNIYSDELQTPKSKKNIWINLIKKYIKSNRIKAYVNGIFYPVVFDEINDVEFVKTNYVFDDDILDFEPNDEYIKVYYQKNENEPSLFNGNYVRLVFIKGS